MSKLARLNQFSQLAKLPDAATPELRWARLPDTKRELSEARLAFLQVGMDKAADTKLKKTKVIRWLHSQARLDALPEKAMNALAVMGKIPSTATLHRWWAAVADAASPTEQLLALVDERKGRQRLDEGWELRATALYNKPTKPYKSTVAIWLQQEGWDVSPQKVRRFLDSLPAELGEHGIKRMGAHYYNQNLRKHKRRDTSNLPVGHVYEGDGHTCDVYVQHPNSGGHYRPELTIWIDVRSQFIVGWWLSESESAITTVFSLSAALAAHNHTPALIHVDPGSGFKNKVIDQEFTGYLQRFGIEAMHAIAGNAKGKGLVEGLFRWFEERVGKTFDAYCGHCRTDDALSRLSDKIKHGRIKIPTFDEYRQAIAQWVEWHNSDTKDSLDGMAPRDLWAELQPVPLHCSVQELMWPQTERTVSHWSVTLDHRIYQHDALRHFSGKQNGKSIKVIVQYNLHDDSSVVIRDRDQRFICEAPLVSKPDWMPESRIEQGIQKRLKESVKRLERHIEEKERRARPVIEHTDTLATIEELSTPLEHEAQKNADPEPEIDVFDVSWLDQE